MSGFKVLSGGEALAWCTDHRAEWDSLHATSRSSNPFVSSRFVRTWYEHYADSWTPVVVVAEEPGGGLTGLLPLARPHDRRVLVGAGDHHAEYQQWLCRPGDHDEFLRGALPVLFSSFPGHVLQLRYVADPDCWRAIERSPGHGRVEAVRHYKPVLDIDRDRIAATERKPGNRSKLNRLKRGGETEVRRLRTADDLRPVFDEIIDAYDFRQGAANGTLPFRSDPRKKDFHLAWMRAAPDQFHVTCMTQGERVIAATIGTVVGDEISMSIHAHSPEHAEQSPGKILLYQTAKALSGGSSLDLTPGGDPWKDRIANRREPVWEVRIQPSAWRRYAAQAPVRVRSMAKRLTFGRDPRTVRRLARRARRISRRGIVTRLQRLLPQRDEYRVYQFPLARYGNREPDPAVRVNCLRDLLDLAQRTDPGDDQACQDFLRETAQRLAAGQRVYTLAEDSGTAHRRWVVPQQAESFFTEVNTTYRYPVPGPVLYDAYTLPSARSKGYSRRVTEHVLHDLARITDADTAYVSTLADGGPAIHVIEKLGASHVATIVRRRFLWLERIQRAAGACPSRVEDAAVAEQ